MIPALQGLGASVNLVMIVIIFGLLFGLYIEGTQKGKLRGQIEVLRMKNENIQTANKEISTQNFVLKKDLRDFEKTKELYGDLQDNFAYTSALKDSLQNRSEKLYKQTTGKRIDVQKDIKIEIRKRGKK